MHKPSRIGILTVLVGLSITGCTAGADGPTESPAPSGTAAAASPTESSPSAAACPSGAYRVQSFEGRNPIPLPAGDAELSGSGGGMTLTFDAGGHWTLTGSPDDPATARAGELRLGLAIDGSATGTFDNTSGNAFLFSLTSAKGSATVTGYGADRRVGMDQVARAIAPGGTAQLSCTDDRLTVDSDAVTMTLRR
jgi:hypothetical protein